MKKIYLALVIIITCSAITLNANAQQYSWTQKANFPGAARYYDAGFSIGQYGFIGCGENNPYNSQYFDFYKWKQSTNTWSTIASYPGTGVGSPVCASIEGYGYVGLGFNVITQEAQTDLWKYDTLSNTWTAMATFPGTGRYDASWFVVGHKLYVVGGSHGGPPYLNDVWVYDAHQNTWTQLNNSPANSVDNMVAFAIGNHGYIGGGYDDSYYYTACWQYDTTSDSWTSINPLPNAIFSQPRTFVLGSKGYACTGKGPNYNTTPVGYAYDTVTKAWSEFTNMGSVGIERFSCAAFTIGKCGYIGTGMDSLGNLLNSFWQYGPDTSSPPCVYWTQKANFTGAARYYDAGFSIGKHGYIGCGENNPYNSQFFDFYKWTQATNTWAQVASYPGTGVAAPVSASIDGYGYVGLGFDVISQTPQQDLWRYDTLANTWTQMASLPGAGRYDCGFFTVGHKLYVISGSTGGPPYLPDAWVYDAHQNTWTQLNAPPSGRTDNLVSFAIGNHGYIGGGWNGSNVPDLFWQYDTTNDSWTSIAAMPQSGVWADPRTFVIGTKAYVCTGQNDYNQTMPLGYTYDTVSRSWEEFTNMGSYGIERSHCVAFSIGNYGYIGTGADSLGNMLNTFWQYYPCSGDTNLPCTSFSINIAPLSPIVCSGQSLTLVISGAGGAVTYSWSPSAGLSATTGDSVIVSPTIATTYTIIATIFGGCSDTITDAVSIIPAPNVPSITVSVTGDSLISSAVSYNQWFFDDKIMSDSTRQVLVIKGHAKGWYTVTVTNPANGCTTTSDSTTAVYQVSPLNNQLSIYPNPLTNTLFVKIKASVQDVTDWNLQITDVLGRTVYANTSLSYSNEIDVSNLIDGLYFIKVACKTGQEVFPVLKQ